MSTTRSFLMCFSVGFLIVSVFTLINGAWPDFGVVAWLVFVAGLVVIAVVPLPLRVPFLHRDNESR